ncbi:MFS transporter [Rhodococcus sp. HNM0569]|nr:MFS transporter [Rhodococcus sp. HNM0569]NLU82679.1 MFS transporter [Rhodococcus sp. HNM0569]
MSGLAFAAFLPLISAAEGPVSLGVVLMMLGAASGCLDVAMNTAGLEFQRDSRAQVISRLHGGYSLGVLAGAAGGAWATHLQVSVLAHFVVVSVVLCPLIVGAAVHFPDAARTASHAAEFAAEVPGDRSRQTAGPCLSVVPVTVAALAIGALLLEGMVTDWSALLVGRDYDGGASVGAAVVVAFSVAMFVSRSAGDVLAARLGHRRLLATCSAVIAGSLLVGLAQPTATGVFVSLTVVGLASGPLFPLAVSLASERSRSTVAAAAAQVSAVGYLAYLAGPPMIGMVAGVWTLPVTVAVVGTACAVVVATVALTARTT